MDIGSNLNRWSSYIPIVFAPHPDPEASILEFRGAGELGVHGSVTQLIHSLEQYFNLRHDLMDK